MTLGLPKPGEVFIYGDARIDVDSTMPYIPWHKMLPSEFFDAINVHFYQDFIDRIQDRLGGK